MTLDRVEAEFGSTGSITLLRYNSA
jgi:hypothetical protein